MFVKTWRLIACDTGIYALMMDGKQQIAFTWQLLYFNQDFQRLLAVKEGINKPVFFIRRGSFSNGTMCTLKVIKSNLKWAYVKTVWYVCHHFI